LVYSFGLWGFEPDALIAGAKSNFFAKKFYVYVQPPTAASFFVGQPVRFQGFGIGYVDFIELLEHGTVNVTLQLLDKYRPMLHQGAKVQLAKEGLIGESFVRMSAGDGKSVGLQDLDTLEYESSASIEQLLEDVKPTIEQADKLLREFVELTTWVNNPEGEFRTLVANLKDFSAGLDAKDTEKMSKELVQLLHDAREVMGEIEQEKLMTNFSHAMKSTAVTLDEMKPFVRKLGQDGGESLEKMNVLLDHMQELAETLNVVSSDVTELTPELPSLARELRESIGESRLLMKSIRQSWLFGGSSSESESETQGRMLSPPAVDFRP
jgi:phospholipid/cholesterol/gamma-HCH transport system substrate-binding protein